MLSAKLLGKLRIDPGERVKLNRFNPSWAKHEQLKALGKDELKDKGKAALQQSTAELAKAQNVLYAADTHAVLIVIQAMDAAGKDGTIRHVMSGVNPQGCQVFSFKKPSAEELDHNFLWRYANCLPERGRIGIFNRSYYEEVLVVKVHPELLDAERVPTPHRGKSLWKRRYEDINTFEHHLTRNGTVILKFFLNVSKAEQKRRLLSRMDDPHKNWKYSAADIAERECWSDYMKAYEEMLTATSTKWAPWHIIPADHKWITHALVAEIVRKNILSLKLKYPTLSAAQKKELAAAKRKLERE